MPTSLHKENWNLYNNPGIKRVPQPIAPTGSHSLEVPAGKLTANFSMWLTQFTAIGNSASQSSDVYVKPVFAGTAGTVVTYLALRGTSINPVTGQPGDALYLSCEWNKATGTRRFGVLRKVGSNNTYVRPMTEVALAGQLEDAIHVRFVCEDVNSADVHIQVDVNGSTLWSLLDENSPLYGARGVWGVGVSPSVGGLPADTVLLDTFMASVDVPTAEVPASTGGGATVTLWSDDFSPDAAALNSPDFGEAYQAAAPASLADYIYNDGELVAVSAAPTKYVSSALQGVISPDGYRIATKVGRKGTSPFHQLGFCYNPETSVSYTAYCDDSGWKVTKMLLTLPPQDMELPSAATWDRDTGTPVDIIVKPGVGFDLYINGVLAQSFADTDYLAYTGLYFGLSEGSGWQAMSVTDDLTVQEPLGGPTIIFENTFGPATNPGVPDAYDFQNAQTVETSPGVFDIIAVDPESTGDISAAFIVAVADHDGLSVAVNIGEIFGEDCQGTFHLVLADMTDPENLTPLAYRMITAAIEGGSAVYNSGFYLNDSDSFGDPYIDSDTVNVPLGGAVVTAEFTTNSLVVKQGETVVLEDNALDLGAGTLTHLLIQLIVHASSSGAPVGSWRGPLVVTAHSVEESSVLIPFSDPMNDLGDWTIVMGTPSAAAGVLSAVDSPAVIKRTGGIGVNRGFKVSYVVGDFPDSNGANNALVIDMATMNGYGVSVQASNASIVRFDAGVDTPLVTEAFVATPGDVVVAEFPIAGPIVLMINGVTIATQPSSENLYPAATELGIGLGQGNLGATVSGPLSIEAL